jgi:hypothetical protein
MKTRKWLVVTQRGNARLTAKTPALARGEIGIVINLDVPNEMFETSMPSINLNMTKTNTSIQPSSSADVITPKGVIKVDLRT